MRNQTSDYHMIWEPDGCGKHTNKTEPHKRGAKQNNQSTRFSFDMLGEGARTDGDAQQYLQAYSKAIDEIGKTIQPGEQVEQANGISVKLSALHPRYYYAQHQLVMDQLMLGVIVARVQGAEFD